MRKKELRIVVTFKTTTAAIAYEKYCNGNNISGRLIPVPVSITSSCGLAFSAPVSEHNKISVLNLEKDKIYEIII